MKDIYQNHCMLPVRSLDPFSLILPRFSDMDTPELCHCLMMDEFIHSLFHSFENVFIHVMASIRIVLCTENLENGFIDVVLVFVTTL